MWRFFLFLSFGFAGSVHAADEKEMVEAPKPEPVKPVQIWDESSRTFLSISEAFRRAPGRRVFDQVPTVRDRVMQADGIQVLENRRIKLIDYRFKIIDAEEAALVARYKGM